MEFWVKMQGQEGSSANNTIGQKMVWHDGFMMYMSGGCANMATIWFFSILEKITKMILNLARNLSNDTQKSTSSTSIKLL
jgi:hypothetical protein